MFFTLTQFVLLAAVAAFFGYWLLSARRRSRRSWESIIARLSPDLSIRSLSEHFPWKEGLSATPNEAWDKMHGVNGLFAIYRNAGVMLEIANFAFRNGDNIDQELVQMIHSDAAQIRFCVIVTIAQYILNQGTEGVRLNAFRAASMYTGLAAHLTELLQSCAPNAVPSLVGAA